ncbi:hypothetical protein [Streptomyces sp. NPDC056632]|uniref:hypothetical protein n=1 Tax=Streptomyces sp. NPDC056632 TaxID=3345884 RepID=UPI0036CCEC68
MTPTESGQVVLELERLRGTVETGFARVDGQLALLVQRSDQTDKQIDEHDKRIDALEKNRWPLPSIASVTGCAALALTLYERIAR